MASTIAYLGIPGSYSHSAATAYFSDDHKFLGLDSFGDIFDAINKGKAQSGVLPIENTLAGSIYENYDLLEAHDLHITGEYYLRIKHCLLVNGTPKLANVDMKQVKKVYSHPKALEQCATFFKEHPWIEKFSYSDTAHAARYVKEQDDPSLGAIANMQAAELYGLAVAQSDLEDDLHNYTRFLVIAKKQKIPPTANKCSLIIQIPHVLGSLYKTLGILEGHQCNLMKIESRPIRGKFFEYVFYFDFRYDAKKHDVNKILEDLGAVTASIHLLGIYQENHI